MIIKNNQKWGTQTCWPAFKFQAVRVDGLHGTFLKVSFSIQGVAHTRNTANGLSVMTEVTKCAELVSVKVVC